jgi:hypothetical protein
LRCWCLQYGIGRALRVPVVLNLIIGMMTPPVGVVLFVIWDEGSDGRLVRRTYVHRLPYAAALVPLLPPLVTGCRAGGFLLQRLDPAAPAPAHRLALGDGRRKIERRIGEGEASPWVAP